jgi:hypothetical protein
MSDEPSNPHRAYMEGREGIGVHYPSGPQSNAYEEGRRRREAEVAATSTSWSPIPTSSAGPTGFPTTYVTGSALPAGGTTGGALGLPIRALGWLSVLLPLALVLLVLGPRRGDALLYFWVLLVPLWVGLYPINGLATAGMYLWLSQAVPQQQATVNVPAAAAALVVFVVTQRLEHQLARRPVYRIPRHVVRIGVIGLAAYAQLLRNQGHLLVDPLHLHVWRFLRNPVPVAIVVLGAVAVAHYLLWTDNGTRRAWHDLLAALRLRDPGG